MNTKSLAKMYDYENLIYYDNALYEHNHNHLDENHKYFIGKNKIDVKSYHNKGMLSLLLKGNSTK